MLKLVIALVFVAPLLAAPSASAAETIRVISEDPSVDAGQLDALGVQAGREYDKLKALFNADVGVVTLRVRRNGVARHLPPATIVIPSRLVSEARAITAHELTHLLTQGWANGLLKEGLAVYAQDKLGEQAGWPNDGRSVHRVAEKAVAAPKPMVRGPGDANRVLSTRNPGRTALRRAAYAVAGSWVTWLIEEKFGGDVSRFMATLYGTGSYTAALGQPFQPLRTEWRAFVARAAAQPPG